MNGDPAARRPTVDPTGSALPSHPGSARGCRSSWSPHPGVPVTPAPSGCRTRPAADGWRRNDATHGTSRAYGCPPRRPRRGPPAGSPTREHGAGGTPRRDSDAGVTPGRRTARPVARRARRLALEGVREGCLPRSSCQVALMQTAHPLEVALELSGQRTGQHGDPILRAFGAAHADLPAGKVHVLDPEL